MNCIKCNNEMKLDDKDSAYTFTRFYYLCEHCYTSCCFEKNKISNNIISETWIDENGFDIGVTGV